jgi:FAD/FMN-containing dehydrogenase
VGGLIPSVGVGGFTLNGGLGWLTSAHGVALDNLLEADVVLANGRILTCSEMENEDLFWAIRGAGSCFGVVTRFVFQAHEINNKVWVRLLFPTNLPLSSVRALSPEAVLGVGMIPLSLCLGSIALPLLSYLFEIRKILC